MIFMIIIIFIICITHNYEHRMGEIGLVPQNTVDDLIKQKFEAPLPRFENFSVPRLDPPHRYTVRTPVSEYLES